MQTMGELTKHREQKDAGDGFYPAVSFPDDRHPPTHDRISKEDLR